MYQKTINFGALPNNATKKVAHNISNLSKIINYKAVSTNGIGMLSLPDVSVETQGETTYHSRILCTANGEIQITCNVDRSAWSAYVTLQYTKTTG